MVIRSRLVHACLELVSQQINVSAQPFNIADKQIKTKQIRQYRKRIQLFVNIWLVEDQEFQICSDQQFQRPSNQQLFVLQRMNGKISFVDEMKIKIAQFQIQKLQQQENNPLYLEFCRKETKARQALIQINDESTQQSKDGEGDVGIGRWGSDKTSVGVRLSLSKKSVKRNNFITERNGLPSQKLNGIDTDCGSRMHNRHTISQTVIPQLKSILTQLSTPSNRNNLAKDRKKNHVRQQLKTQGVIEVLVTRNEINRRNMQKKQIQSASKQQQKGSTNLMKPAQASSQNQRPLSKSGLKGQLQNNYQKIKRKSQAAQTDIIHEKEILSQLIKGNIASRQATTINALSNMSNYFSLNSNTAQDKVRKISSRFILNNVFA